MWNYLTLSLFLFVCQRKNHMTAERPGVAVVGLIPAFVLQGDVSVG
jgi:hypothetical protein